jgi:hypothetical protein
MKTVNINPRNAIEPIEWTPYTGETVIIKTIIRKGQRIQETQFYEDKVKAMPRGNAYIIGNGPSRKGFDLNLLKSTGQVYGCNALYRDFVPDYLFSVDAKMTQEISKSHIWEKCVCYAPSLEVKQKRRTQPYSKQPTLHIRQSSHMGLPQYTDIKKLYLIGFDFREFGKDQLNNIYQDSENYGPRHSDTIFAEWLTQFRRMIKQRPYCHFTVVHNDPPEYFHHLQTGTDLKNTSVMSYSEF